MKLLKGCNYNLTLQIRVNDDIEEHEIDDFISSKLYDELSVEVVDITDYEIAQWNGLKIGDEFYEVQHNIAYPRFAHSGKHIEYCMKNLGKITFLTKEDAKKAGYKIW